MAIHDFARSELHLDGEPYSTYMDFILRFRQSSKSDQDCYDLGKETGKRTLDQNAEESLALKHAFQFSSIMPSSLEAYGKYREYPACSWTQSFIRGWLDGKKEKERYDTE